MENKEGFLQKIRIPPDWANRSLETFLRQGLKLSRAQVRALKKENKLILDGRTVFVSNILYGGEELLLSFTPSRQNIKGEAIPLEIVYEDSFLAVINKPPGMVVHPVKQYQSGTLANALIDHWRQNGEAASFHPVHRLDRLTSGLVLIAKNAWIHQQLSLQIYRRNFHRFYLAVCSGVPSLVSGQIAAPIKDFPETPRRIIAADGKPSLTRYRVLQKARHCSLLAIKLSTGRTHQIRVHLSSLGLPLWGDALYGESDPDFKRPALHAARLTFIHPVDGRKIKNRAETPRDLSDLLKTLNFQ